MARAGLAGEEAGTAWGALQRLQLQGGETIAIFGQGPVGLSATQLAVAMGARVIALDVSDERLELAKGFGFFQAKPSSAFSPVAVTPDGDMPAVMTITEKEGALDVEMDIGGKRWERIMPGGHRTFRMKLPLVDEGTYVVTAELSQKDQPESALEAEASFVSTESYPEGLK